MFIKKTIREIWQNKGQFLTIFLMIMLGMLVYTGVNAYSDGMKDSAKRAYENQNLADIWVYSEDFTDEIYEDICDISNVAEADRLIVLRGSISVDGEEVPFDLNFTEKNDVSCMYIYDGEEYTTEGGGIWIGRLFANACGIKVGDTVTIKYDKYTLKEKVRGIVGTPDHMRVVSDEAVIFQNVDEFGFCYLAPSEFPYEYMCDKAIDTDEVREFLDSREDVQTLLNAGLSYDDIKAYAGIDDSIDLETAMKLADSIDDGSADEADKIEFLKALDSDFDPEEMFVYTTVFVDVEGVDDGSDEFADKISDVKTQIYEVSSDIVGVTGRTECSSYTSYTSESEEGDSYAGIFCGIFIAIAILTVVTTMNRFVQKQRVQIGTLKALGFKKGKIIRHYVSFGLLIAVPAAVIGMVVGYFTIGTYFFALEMSMYDVAECSMSFNVKNIYMCIAIIVLITLITYLSCRSILKENAAQTLRVGVPNVKVSVRSKHRLTSHMNFSAKWNLRDIARSKARSLMAIIGVAGSTLLIVAAFGLTDSISNYLDVEFDNILNFEYKAVLNDDYTDNELKNIENKYGDASTQTVAIEYRDKDGDIETSSITVDDSDGLMMMAANDYKEFFNIRDGLDGQTEGDATAKGAIYVTYERANKEGIKLGDTIEYKILGEENWQKGTVCGIYRDPQMQEFSMTREAFEAAGNTYKPDTIYTADDWSDLDPTDVPGMSSIVSRESMKSQMKEMLSMMSMMRVLLIVVSAILGFVIISNMGIMSITEKNYQFATLKVLGMKASKIRHVFMEQNVCLAIVGIIVGLPLGFWVCDYIYKYAIGEDYDFTASIDLSSYFIAIGGTILITLFTCMTLSGRLKKIDMVSALKANE